MDDEYDPFKDLAKIDDEHLKDIENDKRDHFDPFKGAEEEAAAPPPRKKINRDEMLTPEAAAETARKQAEQLGEFAQPEKKAEPFPEPAQEAAPPPPPPEPAAAPTPETTPPPAAGGFDDEPLVADLPRTPLPPEPEGAAAPPAADTPPPASSDSAQTGSNPIPPELGNPIPPELGSDPALDHASADGAPTAPDAAGAENPEQGATPDQPFNMGEENEEVPELYDDDMRNYIEKGESVDITELDPSLRHIVIGVGWDQRKVEEQMADIDLSIFLLNTNNMTNLDEDFVFYNNETDLTESAKHLGDNRTGAGEGDDEQIEILLTGLSYESSRIACVLSIYDDEFKGITFDIAKNIYIRILNKESGEEIIRFNIPDEDLAGKRATYLASIVREGPNWVFEAESNSVEGSLADIAQEHGLVIKELQSTG